MELFFFSRADYLLEPSVGCIQRDGAVRRASETLFHRLCPNLVVASAFGHEKKSIVSEKIHATVKNSDKVSFLYRA
jgi:hypothetical protein